MLIFAELDCSPCAAPNLIACGSGPSLSDWAPGQLPVNKDTWFNQSYTVGQSLTGNLTRYYYDMSHGQNIVLGDYLNQIVSVNCSNLTPLVNYSDPNNPKIYYDQSELAQAVMNNLNIQFTANPNLTSAHGYHLSDFDLITNENAYGSPKPAGSNSKID
jgi:hypothetical protein